MGNALPNMPLGAHCQANHRLCEASRWLRTRGRTTPPPQSQTRAAMLRMRATMLSAMQTRDQRARSSPRVNNTRVRGSTMARSSAGGGNTVGQLGVGDAQARGDGPGEMGATLPVVTLGPGRTAVELSAGFESNCARLDDGPVKCWGATTWGSWALAIRKPAKMVQRDGRNLACGRPRGRQDHRAPHRGRRSPMREARRWIHQVMEVQRLRLARPRRYANPRRWPRRDGRGAPRGAAQVDNRRAKGGTGQTRALGAQSTWSALSGTATQGCLRAS